MEQHKKMKIDLYIIRALESKGYELDKVIKMTDEEIDSLSLSKRIIDSIKDYKERGAKPVQEIKEQIFDDISVDDNSRIVSPEVIETYKENTEEQQRVLEEVKEIAAKANVVAEDEVVIERIESSKEDIDIIKEALQSKELKNVSAYVKHLKSVVPAAIIDAVDSTVVSRLVNERIAELKEKAK